MKRFCLSFLLLFVCLLSFGQVQENRDSIIFQDFLNYAAKEKIVEMKTGDRILSIARYFLETPYVVASLEVPNEERLRVNLRELDCMTYVETVLALHNVLKESNPNYGAYKQILTFIRYRNGIISGYPSRLHYTTEWLFDNRKKEYIRFVRMGCDTEPFKPEVNFMTTHPELYPALKSNPEFVLQMAKHEEYIHSLSIKYLPKEKLTDKDSYIHTGDIIAITTAYKGLDFSHLGFAVREKDEVFLLHASSTGKKVMFSSQNLKDYLSDIKKHTGIVVVRPL